MQGFQITTNIETAKGIEKFFQSSISHGRSLRLLRIQHEKKYSIATIEVVEGEHIKPEDIFWMGYFTGWQP